MKKYLVMAAIAAVAIVSITLTGKSMYESRVAKNDNFLLKNVEALTRDEDSNDIGDTFGPCPGRAAYANVAVTYGTRNIRAHYEGDWDITYNVSVTYCSAYGDGELAGSNSKREMVTSNPERVPCKGEQYHNEYFY